MSDINILYSTAPDEATARAIAEALVEARLAACVNIIPGMRSVYRWEGEIGRADELVLIVKTTAGAAGRAMELIRERHPYETPCVLALAVGTEGTSRAFADWVAAETAER